MEENNIIYREDIPRAITNTNPIGIELGVAGGRFSVKLNNKHSFKKFYCVDKWNDKHNIKEYYDALHRLNKDNIYVLRMSFEEAHTLFEDNFFDFIYIDGYAHTGQDSGVTINSWYNKLKKGGVYAGQDYNIEEWPKNVEHINNFLTQIDKKPNLTTEAWASWWIKK